MGQLPLQMDMLMQHLLLGLQEVWEDSGDDGDGRSLARFKKQFVAKVVGSFIL
jgi:hypothetical protein